MVERPLRPDPYVVLGVTRDATHAEIARAYRALVRRHHPDTRGATDTTQTAADSAELRQILAAYTLVGNPVRRADYELDNPPASPPTQPAPVSARNDQTRVQPGLWAGPVLWQRPPGTPRPRVPPTPT
jgi:curved DNA-binding protein CbpA